MPPTIIDIGSARCLLLEEDGPQINAAADGRDLVEEALNHRATLLAVPAQRLGPEFFQLRTGIAGEIIQKVLNYRCQFAVIGDITSHVAASTALRDFVVECERGTDIHFFPDLATLRDRLSRET